MAAAPRPRITDVISCRLAHRREREEARVQDATPLAAPLGGYERAASRARARLRRAARAAGAWLERLNASPMVNEIHRADFDQLLRSTFD
jgi:hypothetical protein